MYFKKLKSKKSFISKKQGFTIIELLVVMIISTIMMATVVLQSRKWNNRLSLNTQVYEFVLAVRQAQLYSLGVKEFPGSPAADKFNIGYGVFIPNSGLQEGHPLFGHFLFADMNGNGIFEYGESQQEKVESRPFTRGVRPVLVCYGSLSNCPTDSANRIREVHISFLRPSPASRAVLIRQGGVPVTTQWPIYVFFGLSWEYGDNTTRRVKIESNGQISILQ